MSFRRVIQSPALSGAHSTLPRVMSQSCPPTSLRLNAKYFAAYSCLHFEPGLANLSSHRHPLSHRHFATVGSSPSHTPDEQTVDENRATDRAGPSGGNPSVSKPVSGDKLSQNPQTTAEQGPTDSKIKQDPGKPTGEKKEQVKSLENKPLGEEDRKENQ
jgi:hypothetical protein